MANISNDEATTVNSTEKEQSEVKDWLTTIKHFFHWKGEVTEWTSITERNSIANFTLSGHYGAQNSLSGSFDEVYFQTVLEGGTIADASTVTTWVEIRDVGENVGNTEGFYCACYYARAEPIGSDIDI